MERSVEPTLRLPLQTGDTSVRAFAVAAASLALAALPVAFLVARLGTHDELHAFVGLEVALPLLAMLGVMLLMTRRTSPSDIVLTPQGFTVIGGAKGGMTIAWSDVAECRLRPYASGLRYLLPRKDFERIEETMPVKPYDRAALRLTLRDGRRIALAVTTNEEEFASLDALRLTINALLAPPSAEPAATALRLRSLPCRECGAPLHPTSRLKVTCPFCKAENAVPSDVVDLVKAGERVTAAETEIDRYVARVRSGTQLARVRRLLLALGAAGVAPAMAGILELRLFIYGHARVASLGWLVVVGTLFVPAIAMLGYSVCIDRRAARFFSLRLSATPGARPGEPPSCRQCGASLPDMSQPVARCIYCTADNVLGIDLAVRLVRDVEQKASVEATTQNAERARAVWLRRGRVLGGALIAVVLALVVIIVRGRPVTAMGGASELRRVSWDPFETALQPALSPDGNHVAYVRMESAAKNQPRLPNLAVMPAAGGFGDARATRITFESPDWRPDGTTILGVDREHLATADARRADASGGFAYEDKVATPRIRPGHPHQLAVVRDGQLLVGETPQWMDDWKNIGPGTHPAWFADGASLAFTRDGRIWAAAVDGPAMAHPISTHACPSDFPAPDPEGRRIAHVATCGRRSVIVIQTLATGATAIVTGGSATVSDLRWQRDWLYFTADDAIFRMRPPAGG